MRCKSRSLSGNIQRREAQGCYSGHVRVDVTAPIGRGERSSDVSPSAGLSIDVIHVASAHGHGLQPSCKDTPAAMEVEDRVFTRSSDTFWRVYY